MDASTRAGRPRSEEARQAVLHAVDDLLVEIGYAAMTMKGVAERAGVGRQTVYRWWSTKAEILYEASVVDAERELAVTPQRTAVGDLTAYLKLLRWFLTESPAGASYRALIAAAQQDARVATLLADKNLLADSAELVLRRVAEREDVTVTAARLDHLAALLVGPLFFQVLSGGDPRRVRVAELAESVLSGLSGRPR